MNDSEKFCFAILKGVLTPEEVDRCNAAIDAHAGEFFHTERTLEGNSKVLGGTAKQKWMEGMLAWEPPACEPFRELLVHARVQPYLNELLGGGHRLDHGPLLIAMDIQLADEGPGDGGLAVIPGSHKANFPLPEKLSFYEAQREYVKEVHTQAGDAIVFTEALTHGTLVWQGAHQRRTLIYKYSPGFQALAAGYHQAHAPDYLLDMTDEERAMLG
jgi:hypothetical protein